MGALFFGPNRKRSRTSFFKAADQSSSGTKNQFVGGYFALTFKSACSVITRALRARKPGAHAGTGVLGKSVAGQSLIRHSKTNVEGAFIR